MSLALTLAGESIAAGVVMLRSRYMTPLLPCTRFVWDNVPEKVTPSIPWGPVGLAAAPADAPPPVPLGASATAAVPSIRATKNPSAHPGERHIRMRRVMRYGMVVPPWWLVLNVDD